VDDEADRERHGADHDQRSRAGPGKSRRVVNDGIENHAGATM
jgi:hypothetical protein